MKRRHRSTKENRATAAQIVADERIRIVVKAAVIETFGAIGIHVRTDEEMDEFRKTIEYSHAWRKAVEKGTKMGISTMIKILVAGALAMFALGLKAYFTGHI